MKNGISVAIRRFVERNIIADDPLPERSWLDRQDMRRVQVPAKPALAGLPVDPLPPLLGRHSGHGRRPQRLRQRLGDTLPALATMTSPSTI